MIWIAVPAAAAACLLALRLALFFAARRSGAPYVRSTPEEAEAVIRLARIRPGIKVYDLGSGDGRLLMLAAEKGAEAVGVELDPFLVLQSRLRARLSPFGSRITVRWGSFWKASIKDADAVLVYLIPRRMADLKAFLERELRPGTIVVSNSFTIDGWPMIDKDEVRRVFAYRRPPRSPPGGRPSAAAGSGPARA